MNPKVITSDDLTVEDLYNGFYVVPDYQREYVWTVEDVELLLTDIHGAYGQTGSERDTYFIGTIVTNYMHDRKLFELIDGQQRITTLYVALIAIRDVLAEQGEEIKTIDGLLFAFAVDKKGNETYRHRIELQYGDSQKLLEMLASPRRKIPVIDLAPTSRSSKNLLEAYKTCVSFLNGQFATANDIRGYFAYLTQDVAAIRVQTDSLDRALHIFETINARGQGLDAMDLLKNLLFRQAQAGAYEQLKQVWKTIADTLDASRERPMVFIRHYLLAHHADKPIRADELYSWLINPNNSARPSYEKDPLSFAHKLLEGAIAYTRYTSGQLKDGTPCAPLENIRQASRTARQHLILLMAASHLPDQSFINLAEGIEQLLFIFVVTGQPANRYEQTFVDWAARIRRMRSQGEIKHFLENDVSKRKRELASQFESSLQQLRSNRLPQYRLKFLLARLTQHIDHIAYDSAPLQNYLDRKTEIEHILPQNYGEAQADEFEGEDAARDYTTKLGNLALLEKTLNVVASNKPYLDKVSIYAKSRFLLTRSMAPNAGVGSNTSVNRALRDLQPYEMWNPTTLLDRERRLIQIARQIWLDDGVGVLSRSANAQ